MSDTPNPVDYSLEKPEETPIKTTIPVREELGATGSNIFGGFINMELNAELQGIEGIRKFDKMRKTDATIAAILRAVKLPILRANWYLEADHDDPNGEMMKDFVEDNLFHGLDQTFDELISTILLFLDYGVIAFEKVYDFNDEGELILKKLAYRDPLTYYRWQLSNGERGLTQQLPTAPAGKTTSPEIPWEKLVIFWNEKEGENYWGVSLLRPVYKHWSFKDILYRLDLVAAERWAIGVPKITMPSSSTPQDRTDAETMAANIYAHEQAYVILPSPDWQVEVLTSGGAGATRDVQPSILHHDRQISKSILAQVLEMGQDTGTQALGKSSLNFFTLGIEAFANYIASVINQKVIKELVDLNFQTDCYPTLTFNGIGDIDVNALSTAIQRLAQSGMLTADDELEDHLRQVLELPKKPEPEEHGLLPDVPMEPTSPVEPTPDDPMDMPMAMPPVSEMPEQMTQLKEFSGFRPLTLAEKKVPFSALKQKIEQMNQQLKALLTDHYTAEKSTFIARAVKALENKDTATLKTMFDKSFNQPSWLVSEVLALVNTLYEDTQALTAKEMKVEVPTTPAIKQAARKTQVDNLLSKQLTDLEFEGKAALTGAIQRQASGRELTAQLDSTLSSSIGTLTGLTASLLAMGAVNQARTDVFLPNQEKIYAYQYSALLDDVTCDTCLSLDGRIVDKNDQSFYDIQPGEIHFNCRCIWVEILQEEVKSIEVDQEAYDNRDPELRAGPRPELPEIETIPKRILDAIPLASSSDKYAPSSGAGLEKPLLKKGGLAEEFAKQTGRI